MNPERTTFTDLTEELRRSFNESFAEPHRAEAASSEDFIAIRVAEHPYAIALPEISGLFAGKAITPVPGFDPGLLGVAGFRGTIVPVFDLRTLLGYSGARTPRWLVLAPCGEPVSLAFDAFEGHVRAPRASIFAGGQTDPSRPYVRGVLSAEGTSRPVLDLPSILNDIGKRTRGSLERRDK